MIRSFSALLTKRFHASTSTLRTVATLVALAAALPALTQTAVPAQAAAPAPTPTPPSAPPTLVSMIGFNHYAAENQQVAPATAGQTRVVLMGDSITEMWRKINPQLFADGHYIDRGISGQTTPQMLLRFRPDVIDLHPDAVVLLAGTNDLAQNTGVETVPMIVGNLESMAEIARGNGIAVVLCSILPADHYGWRKGIEPKEDIKAINAALEHYAALHHIVYVDYFTALATPDRTMPKALSGDGVHPTPAGFAIMQPLMEDAVKRALAAGVGLTGNNLGKSQQLVSGN